MKYLSLIVTLLFVSSSFADYENYDDIVDKLSQYQKVETTMDSKTLLSGRTYSRAHLGLGLAQTFYDARPNANNAGIQSQGGLLINVGVDLVNRHWGLEGSFANFGNRGIRDGEVRLREFTIKGLYKPQITKNWNMRMGLGMSSRFLNVTTIEGAREYRTPSGIFSLGLDNYINSFVSVGADFNFKTAMISDTIDNNSVDLSFRVDTHF